MFLSKRHWHHLIVKAAIWIYKGLLQSYKNRFLVYKWMGVNSSKFQFQLHQTQGRQRQCCFLHSNVLPWAAVSVANASSPLLERSQLYLCRTFVYHLRYISLVNFSLIFLIGYEQTTWILFSKVNYSPEHA